MTCQSLKCEVDQGLMSPRRPEGVIKFVNAQVAL
jgi:hypothetical protein